MNTTTQAQTAARTAPPNLPFRGDPAQQGREVPSPATGPKTPAGKAIAARNATTHGFFARDIVLPALGEDPAAYDALLQELVDELPPRNLLERHYLEQIAAASWRLRRLHRWQAQVYEDPALEEDQRLDKLDKVLRHENTLTRQIDRAVRLLGRDLRDLFLDRARQEARYALDAPERGDARTEAMLAVRLQREVRRRLHPSVSEGLLGLRLDNDNDLPAPTDAQKCGNEPAAPSIAHKNCGNEPSVPLVHGGTQAPLPVAERGRGRGLFSAEGENDGRPRHGSKQTAAPTDSIGTEAAQTCETENCENEPHVDNGSEGFGPDPAPVSFVHPTTQPHGNRLSSRVGARSPRPAFSDAASWRRRTE